MAVSVQTTTNLAFGGAGLVDLALWVQQSWAAGAVVVPSTELISFGLACLAPIAHLAYRGLYTRLEAWAEPKAPPAAPGGGGV